MKSRYHLLNINNNIKNNETPYYISPEVLNNINKMEKNNIPFTVSIYSQPLSITVCLYEGLIFLGVEQENNISFNLTEQIYAPANVFDILLNRLYNYLEQNKIPSQKLQKKWEKTIPLLNKITRIEKQYGVYKKEYNQYKELNIPNNGFIGDKEDYINQCVFLFECYQTINDSKASIDFNSMSIFKDNIPYISIKDGQIQNNFGKTEIKNSLNKLVEEYIDTLQNEIQNQFNLLHKEQGLVPITNFKGQYRIYNIKNDKDKNIFHYEIENDNINQLLDCKMRLSELRQELLKEQQKSIAYEDMDSIENETENNIDDI